MADVSVTPTRKRDRDLGRTITQPVQAAKADGRNRVLLVRMDSSQAGEVFCLSGSNFRIGRHPDNAVCMDDQGLSRHHVRITPVGERYYLEDLGSSNGTFVNGQRVTGHELTNGDTLQLGPRVCFRFTIASSDEERMLKQLYESSVRDPMTRAYNRHYLCSQLRSELPFAIRHNTQLSVLIFDVDHFKRVNDTHGHLAGDAVLKTVAALVDRELRREDLFARYGGEEFVVLLRDVPLDGALIVAERLRLAVEQNPTQFGHTSIPATISVGCAAVSCCDHPSPDALIQRADGRLYQAKRSGRNRCVARD